MTQSRQVTHFYDDEVRAQAQALMRQGKTALATSEELSIPHRTVCNWYGRWREVARETEDRELYDDDYRIVRKAGDLIHDGLDQLKGRDDIYKFLVPLNIVRGTPEDKILKRQEPKYGMALKSTGPIVIVCNAQAPVVEGEAVEQSAIEGEVVEPSE